MILPAQTIRGLGIIEPFHERTVEGGKTYGLSSAGYDVRIDQGILVGAGTFKLASTVECFYMPDDVLGVVHDKSTWARIGIALQNTVIEPGWSGYLTLEITNHSTKGLFIDRYSPIAQIVFHRLEEATEQPYIGKYQNQERGPQEARFEPTQPRDCHAKRWNATPAFDGPHPAHLFTYGAHNMYTGSCRGWPLP